MSSRERVVVYGATGHAGARVCAALLRRGISVVAVGRDESKLGALVKELGGPVEVVTAAIDDSAGLRSAIAKGGLVIHCAGPFARYGRVVQDAALATGRHCLDMSGEPAFVRATLERDAEAKERDVLLVSGVGFDVVPTDALAAVLAEALGGARSVRVAYSRLDAGPTSGIGLTMLQGLLDGGLAFVDGVRTCEPLGHDRWSAPFPEPLGAVRCASVPWGDVASLPETTGARTVRAYLPSTFPPPAPASLALRTLRWALSSGSFARLSDCAARHMARRLPLGTGAAASLSAVVEVTGERGTETGWMTAPPGIAAEAAALCASLAAVSAFGSPGAQTPSQAFGARRLLEELTSFGLQWGMTNGCTLSKETMRTRGSN